MDSKCSALEHLRKTRIDRDWTDDNTPDYVQVIVGNKVVMPDRHDGAGPSGAHLRPDEGLAEIVDYYVPADGRRHPVRLKFCRTNRSGQLAVVSIGDILGHAPPAPEPELVAHPAPLSLDHTAVSMYALDHATEQGRAAMEAARAVDADRQALARMNMDASARYAEAMVKMSEAAAERNMQFASQHMAALESISSGFQSMAAQQIADANARADQARAEFGPMALLDKAKPWAKMGWQMIGGWDGVKAKLKGFAAEVVGSEEIAEQMGGQVVSGLTGLGREALDLYKEATMHKAALEDLARGGGGNDDADDIDDDEG